MNLAELSKPISKLNHQNLDLLASKLVPPIAFEEDDTRANKTDAIRDAVAGGATLAADPFLVESGQASDPEAVAETVNKIEAKSPPPTVPRPEPEPEPESELKPVVAAQGRDLRPEIEALEVFTRVPNPTQQYFTPDERRFRDAVHRMVKALLE